MAVPPSIPACVLPLLPTVDDLRAWAVAVMGLDGDLVYTNPGMRALLGGEAPAEARIDYLVNPDFAKLAEAAATAADPGLIFEGLLTTGDRQRESHTVQAQVWRCQRYLVISAEHNVEELDRLNWELVNTNRRVNGLQRELLKRNRLLEDALEKLRQTQAMLVHAEKMNALGQLVAGVAHEINNPLGFAMSNLHSLNEAVAAVVNAYDGLESLVRERAGLAERADEIRKANDLDFILADFPPLLGGLEQGLARIGTIVQHLRNFSRLDQAERKRVDLRKTIEEIIGLAGASLRERGIDVETALDDVPPLECYPSALNQVFMNLVVNAAQAMEGGGSLRISAQPLEDGWLEIRFRDSGCGIPKEHLGRIFDPFFTTKPVGAGTGLGLSLAHKIVTEGHGGRISVTSVPGEGTEFVLRLPQDVSLLEPDERRFTD